MAMSKGEAFHYLQEIDSVYFDLYLEKSMLLGELPCGRPGYPGFKNVSEIAARIEQRKIQISLLRIEVTQLRNTVSDAEPIIRAIAAELNLPKWEHA